MRNYINAKSLKFLSLEGLYAALEKEKEIVLTLNLVDHYFTGEYPIKPSDNLSDLKVKQLSLVANLIIN